MDVWADMPKYRAATLALEAGARRSSDDPRERDETMYVAAGKVAVEHGPEGRTEDTILRSGGSLHLPPGVRWRVTALDDATLVFVGEGG